MGKNNNIFNKAVDYLRIYTIYRLQNPSQFDYHELFKRSPFIVSHCLNYLLQITVHKTGC